MKLERELTIILEAKLLNSGCLNNNAGWQENVSTTELLMNFLAAPASQSYVKRVFSLRGFAQPNAEVFILKAEHILTVVTVNVNSRFILRIITKPLMRCVR